MNRLKAAPIPSTGSSSQRGDSVQRNDGCFTTGICNQTDDAKSFGFGSAKSVGSFNASNSSESLASCNVGTFLTARGTICFRSPNKKMNPICAKKTSAMTVSQRVLVHLAG